MLSIGLVYFVKAVEKYANSIGYSGQAEYHGQSHQRALASTGLRFDPVENLL
jgi:hypothetical protein